MSEHESTAATRSRGATGRADIKQRVMWRIRDRYFRALNYVSIYVYVIVVYGGALISDYFLFWLISWLLSEDVQRYPVIALWFDYARIGLAWLLIVCGITHGFLSTYKQVKLEIALSRERDERP